MIRRYSPNPSEDGLRAAHAVLDSVMYDLGGLLEAKGLHTEEMIRVSGFYESAKALWLATGSASDPMTMAMFTNRLRVLADICPPEARELGERLEAALKILEDSSRREKRA